MRAELVDHLVDGLSVGVKGERRQLPDRRIGGERRLSLQPRRPAVKVGQDSLGDLHPGDKKAPFPGP
jgi:hypothetical protein